MGKTNVGSSFIPSGRKAVGSQEGRTVIHVPPMDHVSSEGKGIFWRSQWTWVKERVEETLIVSSFPASCQPLAFTFSFLWLSWTWPHFVTISSAVVTHLIQRACASEIRLSLGLCKLSFCPYTYWRYGKGVEMFSLRQLYKGRVRRRRKNIIFIGPDLCFALNLFRNLIHVFYNI